MVLARVRTGCRDQAVRKLVGPVAGCGCVGSPRSEAVVCLALEVGRSLVRGGFDGRHEEVEGFADILTVGVGGCLCAQFLSGCFGR